MRNFTFTKAAAALPFLWGCAAPVGNLVALQGEGVHVGTRLSASAPLARESPMSALPPLATVNAAGVGQFLYLRGEACIIPFTPIFGGGSVSAGLRWKNRAALGGHLVMADGAGYGADLSLRPWKDHPWVVGGSWTPLQRMKDGATAIYKRPEIEGRHEWEAFAGWAPVPDSAHDGARAIEVGVRAGGGISSLNVWIRLSGSARLLVPQR